MDEIEKLLQDETTIETKKLSQIIAFIGNGKLKDGDNSFKVFVKKISNSFLIQYAKECLTENFNDSGFALQDIVNEIGCRLGFSVKPGFYRGRKNDIGNDGLWTQEDDKWSLIVEVKTTDAYRIALDTIANYRNRLIESDSIEKNRSSILIVVGRNDTGELEAQIRGSKHAWDIRIISVDSLVKLLEIKESLSDESTAQQISIALRPFEYTRVDKLVELIFLAVNDVELETTAEETDPQVEDSDVDIQVETELKNRTKPVSFQAPVLKKVEKYLDKKFIKTTKSSFYSDDQSTGLLISISKEHQPFNSAFDARYWFAFHPHQEKYLIKYEKSFVCYGCGSVENSFLLPLNFLLQKLGDMWETSNKNKTYKHVVIYRENEKFFLRTNIYDGENYDDLTEYKI